MLTYVSILAGAVLGFVAAGLYTGPNDTGTALGARFALGLIGGVVGWWAASFAGGRSQIAWAEEVTQVRSSAKFDALLKSSTNGPVLVDFYANWCLPCRMASSHINELAKEGRSVAVVNIDEQPGLARRFDIMGVPTVLLLNGGEVKGQVTGYQSADDLRELLNGA
jgi:thioredoxin 1